MICISPNSEELFIYKTNGAKDDPSKWTQKYQLTEHSGYVSGIDWSPVTDLIVTSGHDRNAYVWKYDAGADEWKPTLVILRINRAATSVKWSHAGTKFAVASGAKCVPICHFEASNDWWISKMVKNKLKSTVLAIDWCINNKFIVTGSADYKCRVYSAFIAGIDDKEDDGFGSVWPNQHKFGEVLAEFDHAKAWVNSVSWAPSGFRLAFAGHGSTISFVQLLAGSEPLVQTIDNDHLPYTDIEFASDNGLLAVGWDNNIATFAASGSESEPKWEFKDWVDKEDKKAAAAPVKSGFSAARNMFADAANKGITAGAPAKSAAGKTAMVTKHQGTIMQLRFFRKEDGSAAPYISTSALDGRIITWDLSKLSHIDVKALGL